MKDRIDIHPIIQDIVGCRDEITRTEMRDILASLPDLPYASTITGRSAQGELYVGDRWIDDPTQETIATATAWANMCVDITCISALPTIYYDAGDKRVEGLGVRYDEPGSMHPEQHATVLFVAAALGNHEYDEIDQMRQRADRLLIVSGESLGLSRRRTGDEPAAPAHGVARLRAQDWVDGTFIIVADDGMLTMIDPNDGQSADSRDKARHQYVVDDNADIWYRVLPPESVGDAWIDSGAPEWAQHETPPTSDLIYRWWDERVM